MSISSVGLSPVLQWLQSYLSGAGASTGNQSSCGCQPSADTTSISKEAAQLNASQSSQATDPAQASGVNGPQGHPRHRHHGGGQDGHSFVDRLAQSIVSDLQQATGTDASTSSGSPTPGSASASATGGSFIDKLASEIANDLLAKYQQAAANGSSSSQTSSSSQVNTVA